MISVQLKHIFTYEGLQVNVYHANTGQGLPKHNHSYPHIVICHNGSCLVSLEGRNYVIDKNSKPLNLPAIEWHEIEALEDNTVFVNMYSEVTQ
jgi:quercetin dioxygenase-like cupin family protein